MRNAVRLLLTLALGVATGTLWAFPLLGNPITYTEEFRASGNLGGVPFTDADVLLRMSGDTTNVMLTAATYFGFDYSNVGAATVNVSSGAPVSFVNPIEVFSEILFFGTVLSFRDNGIFIVRTEPLAPYGLTSSFGPTTASTYLNAGTAFPTAAGNLVFDAVTSSIGTFTATAVGDPHFTTYAGVHYDYQGLGDFLLTRSTVNGDQFDVQVRTRPLNQGTGAAIMAEAAATLCNHRITFDIDRASAGGSLIWLDGSPTGLSIASPALTVAGCGILELSPQHYKVVWDTGEILDVTNNGTYLDLSSELSSVDGLGSVEGLLASDLDPDAWRLTAAASLFDPVPEPSTLFLLGIGIGLTGLSLLRHREGLLTKI